jgi:hypothetical protein
VVSSKLLYVEALWLQGAKKIALAIANTATRLWEEKRTMDLETVARNATHLEETTPKGRASSYAAIPNYKNVLVARLKTILGRKLTPHDVNAELAERTVVTQAHYYSAGTCTSCDCWTNHLFYELTRYADEAIGAAPSALQTAEKWWATRAVWLSGGTSSTKQNSNLRLQRLLAEHSHKATRRTKKLMCSHFDQGWYQRAIRAPPAMQCRAATKNEPGMKQRPLRASDDTSYLVAAFASNNIEKYLSIQGSVMRQTPEDVRNTTKLTQLTGKLERKYVLCIDYSNFNNTHTTRARVLLNLAMVVAYTSRQHTEQASAALWMAHAHLNHTLDGHLSNQGLSSGERDTARDNTMLHCAYAKMSARHAKASTNIWSAPGAVQMCGDDEIAMGTRWSSAVGYVIAHEQQGHAMQKRKLLLSAGQGEFLQYNMYTKAKLPTQPLPPAINNFISGSWYKTANYNQAQYPEQVASAAASCIRRGAHQPTMVMLCASTCKWLCVGHPWREALSSTALLGARVQAPAYETTSAHEPSKLMQATEPSAVGEYTALTCKKMRLTEAERHVVTEFAAEATFSSYIADQRSTEYVPLQPPSIRKLTIPTKAPPINEKALQHWASSAAAIRYDQMTWMALQLGLPLQLIKRIGLKNIVERCDNGMRAHINKPVEHPLMNLQPEQYALLPGAIAPYFTYTKQGNT